MNEEGTWTKAMSTGYFLHLNLWFLKNFSRRASLTVLHFLIRKTEMLRFSLKMSVRPCNMRRYNLSLITLTLR